MATQPMCRRSWRSFASATGLALLAAACDTPDMGLGASTAADVSALPYVTAELAAQLDGRGHFQGAGSPAGGTRDMISATRAEALAVAYVRSFGPALRPVWEREHGGPIEISNVEIQSPTVFARTPYGRFPDGYHPAFARAFGPYYLVQLSVGSTPVLQVAVSAYGTEVEIDPKGYIERPVMRGMEFIARALPRTTDEFRMISAEEAVEYAARSTGSKVARVPELMRPGLPASPGAAMWKIVLEREVSLRGRDQNTVVRAREVFVGFEQAHRLSVAVPNRGRNTEPSPALVVTGAGEYQQIVDVPIRTGEATAFLPVSPNPEGE